MLRCNHYIIAARTQCKQQTRPPSLFYWAENAGLVASRGSAAEEALTCPTCNKAQSSNMISNRPQESELADEFEAPEADCSLACAVRCIRFKQRSHPDAPEGVGVGTAMELRRHAQPQTVAEVESLSTRWNLPNLRLLKT